MLNTHNQRQFSTVSGNLLMTIRLKYKLYIFAFLATILFIQNGYSQDTIKWKSNIKLSFIDFKAQPPKQSNFDAISNLGLNAFTNVEKRNS